MDQTPEKSLDYSPQNLSKCIDGSSAYRRHSDYINATTKWSIGTQSFRIVIQSLVRDSIQT
jgi:hypothetical protein